MKMPKFLKKRLAKPDELKAMEFVATNYVFEKMAWGPYDRVIEKVLQKKPLSDGQKSRLRKLLKILQKGKGYSEETLGSIKHGLPPLIERVCNNEATDLDYADVADLKKFLAYLKEEERMRFLEAKKMI